MWKFVPNAIRFIPASRKLLLPVDVLRNSIRNTACNRNRCPGIRSVSASADRGTDSTVPSNIIEACKCEQRVEVAKSQPILL